MIEIGNIVKHGKGESSGVGKNVSELAKAVTGESVKDEQLLTNELAAYFASDVSEHSWSGERTTADGELIVDGVAVVNKLKGLTVKKELSGQLLPAGYTPDSRAESVYAVTDGGDYYHVELGAGAADCPVKNVYLYRQSESSPIVGHRYIVISKYRSNTHEFYVQKQIGNVTSRGGNREGVWVTEGWAYTCTSGSYLGLVYYGNIFNLRELADTPYLDFSKKSAAYDLTDMYGEGNEPETAEEFAARLGCSTLEEVLDMSGLASSKPLGIVSKAKYKTIDLGTLTWRISSDNIFINNSVTDLVSPKINEMPSFKCDKYITENRSASNSAWQYLSDKCICGVPSEIYHYICIRDTSYSDVNAFKDSLRGVMLTYESKELTELSSIDFDLASIKDEDGNQLFPDGELHSVGEVYDEVDLKNRLAIKRVGVVDLGTLSWRFNDVSTFNASYAPLFKADINTICSRYKRMISWNLDNMSYRNGTGGIRIRDDAYTDTESFKASLSGVILYYELETPIIVPLDSVQNWYEVEQNGVEEAVMGNSIPLRAEIGYRVVAASEVLDDIENALNS